MNKLYLEQWAHMLLKNEPMTQKAFYNLTIIIKQCLEYSCEEGINVLKENPWDRVKINKKLFVKNKKPKSKTQVYSHSEQKLLIQAAKKRYEKSPNCSTPLMIMLNFQLGLRVGELCALKYSDIDVNEDGKQVINVQRMETEQFEVDQETGKTINKGYCILDRVKSDAGEREIYLNSEARKIIAEVKKLNQTYNRYDDGYLFMNCKKGKRTTTKAVSTYLASLCKEIGIIRKSNHKIRKTYITNSQMAGVPMDTVRRIVGHEDARVTLNSYLFDTLDNKELYDRLEAATVRV